MAQSQNHSSPIMFLEKHNDVKIEYQSMYNLFLHRNIEIVSKEILQLGKQNKQTKLLSWPCRYIGMFSFLVIILYIL